MKRRFCPTEIMLAEYISGCLPDDERDGLEIHLRECEHCRSLVAEAAQAMNTSDIAELRYNAPLFIKKNFWLILGIFSIGMSFFVSRYFFQFLVIGFIAGLKWIVDSKNAKTLIMIQESRKQSREKIS